MDSLVAECFKLLFVTMTIVFFLFVLGVGVRASYISDYREDITQTIQRYGGLTSAAIAKLNRDSAKYYDNSFKVDTAKSNVGDAGYGDTVNYAVNVTVKAPFRVDFLKTTQSTVLFSGVMKGSAVSQVRKATSQSDVVNTASTIDSNFADHYNAKNINVGSTELEGSTVAATDQFESSDYMSVTPGQYVFATAFFGQDQSNANHKLQVAYYDGNKKLLGDITGSSLSSVSAGQTSDPLGKSGLVISDRCIQKMPSNAAYIKFGVSVNKQPNGVSLLNKDYSVFVTQENSRTAVPSYTAMPDVSWAFKPQLSASASSLATAIKNGADKTSVSEAAGTAASGYDQYWALGRIVERGTTGYSVYVSPLNGNLTNSNLSPLMLGYDTTVGSTALSTASGFTSKFKGTVPLTQYTSNMGSPSEAGLVTGFATSSDVYVNSNLANKTVLVGALNSSNSNFTVLVNPFATASSSGSSSSHTAVGANLAAGTNQEYVMGYGIPKTVWKDGYAYEKLPTTIIHGEILPQYPHTFWYTLTKGTTYTQTVTFETDATVKNLSAAKITWWTNSGHDYQPATLVNLGGNKYEIYSTYTWPGKRNNNVRLFDIEHLDTAFDLSTGTYLKFGKLKLEKGSVSTPWCPNPADQAHDTK